MGGVRKIRNPPGTTLGAWPPRIPSGSGRNRKGPSENPFPWRTPEGSGEISSLESYRARETARKL